MSRGLWVLALLVTSCTAGPTQLIVVVDTDLAIPTELDLVRVTVSDNGTRMASEEQALDAPGILPLTVGAAPEDDFLGPIDVVAEGLLGGTVVVTRRARVTLIANETRMLRLDLVASCVGVECDATQSCGPNGCASVEVTELPEWTGTPSRLFDAGGMDAGTDDAGRVDAGPSDAGPNDAGPPDSGPPVACEIDAECDDDIDCTDDRCEDNICLSVPDDSVCDDDNVCTDAQCGATGCTAEPNTASCDDGLFCNGFDQCGDGTCSQHAGDPCGGATVCDESGSQCTGCTVSADCPADSTGTWSGCGYDDGCDEAATRTRMNRTYACIADSCVPTDTPEMEPCARSTSGDSCGVGSCGNYGSCDYANGCDEAASQSRTCTDLICAAGVCSSSNRTESLACSRSTTGDSCGTTSCGNYGACGYSDSCDEAATQSRTCTDFACGGGTCRSTPRTQTTGCGRDTDGDNCGTESCGMFGSCGYTGPCDEAATQSQTCTTPVCGSGSCSDSTMRTNTDPCSRNTDGVSCGVMLECSGGGCFPCTPTLSGNVVDGTSVVTDVVGIANRLTFTNSTPTSGNITAGGGVSFSGSATTTICLWQVSASGNTISFTDWSGVAAGTITVGGASVSGSTGPACVPSPYGCFPPCINRVQGEAGALRFYYSNGTSDTISFGCP